MAQVVTSENIAEFIQTGKVAEFKPPQEGGTEEVKDSEVKTEVKSEDAAKAEHDDLPDGVKAKVDKIIGKKHKEMKEAEEFAEREYNQRRAAEKQADQLKADRDALAAKLAEYEQKSRPAVVEPPKQSDFTTVDEYIEALADYKLEQKSKQRDEAEKQRIANEQARQIQNEFAKSIQAAQEKYPDFQEVTEAADFETPPHITQYMLESDAKAELGYHLSKLYRDDPKELNRILNLSPIRGIAELGKLEASITKTAPKTEVKEVVKEVPVSKAPAPIIPIEAKTTPVNPDLNRDMPYSEYKRLKAQQGKR